MTTLPKYEPTASDAIIIRLEIFYYVRNTLTRKTFVNQYLMDD